MRQHALQMGDALALVVETFAVVVQPTADTNIKRKGLGGTGEGACGDPAFNCTMIQTRQVPGFGKW